MQLFRHTFTHIADTWFVWWCTKYTCVVVDREKYQHLINSGFLFWPPAFTRRCFIYFRSKIGKTFDTTQYFPFRPTFIFPALPRDIWLSRCAPSGALRGRNFWWGGNFKCRRRNHHLLTVVSQSAHFSSRKSGHFTFRKSVHFTFWRYVLFPFNGKIE